jgi:hypothetical protein
MLFAYMATGETIYREIAVDSFKFLLSQIFNEKGIEVISNRNWFINGQEPGHFGEQPIDVAYTVMTLSTFFDLFQEKEYLLKMETAFSWFLGSNRLSQIIYNPCTGGCYDGLEETHVNINQGAESTLSYLLARLTMEKYRRSSEPLRSSFPVKIYRETRKEKTLAQFVMNRTILSVTSFFVTDEAGITKKDIELLRAI